MITTTTVIPRPGPHVHPRTTWSLVFLALLCVPSPATGRQRGAEIPVPVANQPLQDGAAFLRVEYWECAIEERPAFEQVIDAMWGPLFDEMVREGKFTSWTSATALEARDVAFVDGDATVAQVAPAWTWIAYWQARNQTDFERAWREYHDRLAAEWGDAPGPESFCTRVRIANYRVYRQRER